jgi:large subunit ribosomal protein L6
MSRIGKHPVKLPNGVTAKVDGQRVAVKGPKGELSFTAADDIALALNGDEVSVTPRSESRSAAALWGTSRTMVQNLVAGVTKGFQEKLEISGVGFRAALAGKTLTLTVGYSHEINYPVPEGITITLPKPTEIVITGSDRQKVGQVAAEIRAYRKPEPYQGKGIKYAGEYVHRKEGKKK